MPFDAPAESANNPVLVEVTRGGAVESRHRGAFAVVDTDGRVVLSAGRVAAPVFPRSAIKPIQALPLIESGAADAFALSDAELAIACASHNGEPDQVEAVTGWLARLGLGAGDLACGGHAPKHEPSARALARAGQAWDGRHDNCSGKHTGFLTLARQLGAPTRGYVGFAHPVQQRVLGVLEQMTGLDDLTAQPRGIDGCGIPTIALPLGNLALAMARFGAADDQPERRQAACRRLRHALAAQPRMIAGTDRLDSAIAQALGPRCLAKTGAEGVYGAALPELGLGLALKIDDGAGRAAEVALLRLLTRLQLLDGAAGDALAGHANPAVTARDGRTVGEIRPAANFPGLGE
ncbi:L-asparaginase II [Rhodovibrio sodomensis]|uniref:L-asparaginase II n=1 Tax=Rhodovibrio sodomensis TaxID=1088 RepID=A0ABS1DAP7_9PROT|nr:asparaginase [Rhodovibrio sodomensis]MBK1667440.1 L-asparaginase II [Rhodovibrio sodomensis]